MMLSNGGSVIISNGHVGYSKGTWFAFKLYSPEHGKWKTLCVVKYQKQNCW